MFSDHHWSRIEEPNTGDDGLDTQHWRRHDISIAVSVTFDQRVLTTMFRRCGPWDSPDGND
jgi:hypothetical protein